MRSTIWPIICVLSAGVLASQPPINPTFTGVSRVSVGNGTPPAQGNCSVTTCTNPAYITSDARYVLFTTRFSLVSADTNSKFDVYVRDLVSNTTTRVSQSTQQFTHDSWGWGISDDGRYAIFTTTAPQLQGTNTIAQLYLKDLTTGGISNVSKVGTTTANGHVHSGAISPNGAYIAFSTSATNLISGVTDTNNATDVLLYDRIAKSLSLVSVSTTGGVGNLASSLRIPHTAGVFSASGQFLVFDSSATNLVSPATSNQQVFVRNVGMSTTSVVSTNASGALANSAANGSVISSDGGWVGFNSTATNLVTPAPTGGIVHAYLKNVATGAIEIVSVDSVGAYANAATGVDYVGFSGRFAILASQATNLDSLDTNSVADIYLRDRCPAGFTTSLISVSTTGGVLGAASWSATATPDGYAVVYVSDADGLPSPPDTNGDGDIYMNRLGKGVTIYGTPTDTGTSRPRIGSIGEPIIGNSGFKVTCAGQFVIAGGGVYGISTGYLPLPLGVFWIDPGLLVGYWPAPPMDANGVSTVPVPVPNNPSICGFATYWQFVWDDASLPPPNNISASDALRITLY